MARQEGPIFLRGTIEGINFYHADGKPLARKAGGGFTREAIKRSPRMEIVRQSNSEFAACSQVNKQFKLALQPFLQGYKDGSLHSRLMQLFIRIKDQDRQSERGKRRVAVGLQSAAGQELVAQFPFTPGMDPLSRFTVSDRERLAFTIDIRPELFASDSDSVQILAGLVRFNFETLEWQRALAEPVRINIDAAEPLTMAFPTATEGEGLLFAVVKITRFRCIHFADKERDVGIAVRALWDEG